MLEQIEIVDNVTDANVTTCTVTDEQITAMNADLLDELRERDAEMEDHIAEDDRAFMETCIIEFTDAA